jgi:hypothetical protein
MLESALIEARMAGRHYKGTLTAALAIELVAAAAACGDKGGGPTSIDGPPQGLAACGSSPWLTAPLVAVGDIFVVSPLGNLNPPPHTFPTDHIYLYMSRSSTIAAPGASVLTNVVVQHRTGGGQPAVDDYELTFFPCADVQLQLAHVASLSPGLRALVGTLDVSCNPSYQTGGFTYQQCYELVNISLTAGQIIGSAGASLDVSARDRRVTLAYVNPTRLSDPEGAYGDKHAACAIDYFVASIADPLRAKLGPPGAVRTAPPVCGEVMQDVPNTAAGRWFFPGSPTYPEDPHLALAHDNIDPAFGAFSVGTSVPSLPTGVYKFTPAQTGRVNLDFRFVTVAGETECYEVTGNRRVLIQLVSVARLRIEGFGTGACGDPGTWTLSAGAVAFDR